MTKNKSIGAIQRLKMRGGVQETQTEDKSIQTSLGTINLCPSFTLDSTKEYFKNLLKDSIRPDLKPKDKTITTELEFYRDVKPNSKGTYINDFNIKVNNEDMPFTSRDQVDYFLKNYVGMVENQKLIEQGNQDVKDPKYFFNKIVRKIPHYPFDQDLEDIKKELTDDEKLKGGKLKKSIKSGKNKKYKTKNKKNNTKRNKKI